MNNPPAIVYCIDAEDNIIFVNDAWGETASAGGAPELVRQRILNRDLWDSIFGLTTRHLYKQIIERVRSGHNLEFKLRCDTPEEKCLLSMKIKLKEQNQVEFSVVVLPAESGEPVSVLPPPPAGGNYKLMLCSWCNRIEIAEGNWRELEEAIEDMSLFWTGNLPQLSHGMCPDCYGRITRRLNPSSEE